MGGPNEHEWTQDEIDDQMFQDYDEDDFDDDPVSSGEECGRWRNGKLSGHCLKAGSEECDFECPHGALAEHVKKRNRKPKSAPLLDRTTTPPKDQP